MKAVILAAGRGSRMGDLTEDRPKCLVRVGGRTLLDRQTRALRQAGAGPIGIVTGWHAEAFAGRAPAGVTFFHNPRWDGTTMVESLAAAGKWLERDSVLVAYGDIVYSPTAVRRLAARAADLAIAYDPHWQALWNRRFDRPLDDAETFRLGPAGELADIGGTPADAGEVQGQYMGLLKLTPAAWALIREVRSDAEVRGRDMTGLLRHLVREGLMTVAAVPAPEPWCEFDQPSDIEVGREVLRALDEELDGARQDRAGSGKGREDA